MEVETDTTTAALCPVIQGSVESDPNISTDIVAEVALGDPHNPWEEVRNKRHDVAHTKETCKEATRQRLLDCLLATADEKLDLEALCAKYKIPVRVDGAHGDVYYKSEAELRADVEAALVIECEKAWNAEHQAARQIAEPFLRTLSQAEGISLNTRSIAFSNEDLMPVALYWGPSLCGMFAGRFPETDAVVGMMNRWRVPVKVAYQRKGWMVFSFRLSKDMEKVLSMGPQASFGIHLILEPLTDEFNFNKKLKVNIPVWIRIPDLPLTLWSRSAIEKIASVAGTPVMVDKATILKRAIDGPRVQVIVNILDVTREAVELVMPDKSVFVQGIVFENLPK